MKRLKRTRNANYPGRKQAQQVHFDYMNSRADSVCLAGTFNGWHPSATPMSALVYGHWTKDLVLAPGTYEYALVVDGRLRPDPRCEEKVENSFGGLNSILRVRSCGSPD